MGRFGYPSGHDPDRAPNVGEAWGVETSVVCEHGQWFVEIDVCFDDGVVHRRLGSYFTRQHAEIAASWVKRTAERDIPGPRTD
ncbi:MAG TPA: hypothetical protein VNQ73_22185 [Ilumatobacter sp.]|nr:hypothetical protein [Ilumatobacter sp.]